jgi:tripartite-type tricarboxylate transporter receptor subunit TctC
VVASATPRAAVDRLARALKHAVERPEMQARFDKDGVEPVGYGPAEFRAQIAREIAQYRELAKQAGIKLE